MTEQEYIHEAPRIRKLMLDNAMRFLDSVEDAKDVVQNCLMKLWLMRDKVRLATLDALSVKIVRHQCLDFLKKKNRCKLCDLEAVEETQEADDIETPEMLEEQDQRLMRSLEKVPSRRRMLLELMYLKGKDVETIAQVMGMSADNVRKNLSRARKMLLRIMSIVLVPIVVAFSFDFVNNRLEKSATPLNAPVAEAEKPVARRQEAETAADTSRSEGAKSAIRLLPTTPNNAEVAKSENADRPISPKSAYSSISVCFDLDEEDVKLIATVSYKKTEEGQYITHSCDYKVVNDSGRKMFFVPDEEVKTYVDSPVLNVDINGTLVCVDADGEKTDRYVSVKRCVFDNDEL